MNSFSSVTTTEMMTIEGGWICEANDVKGYSPPGDPNAYRAEMAAAYDIGCALVSIVAPKLGVALFIADRVRSCSSDKKKR